jgi:hypothetical protein
MTGDTILPPGKPNELLAELGKRYYATPGSVTSALKTLAEELNQILLERNRMAAEKGRQGLGLLSQWVMRDEQFYLAQSGAVQAYWITEKGAQLLYNMEMSAPGLGLVRSAPIHFAQTRFQPNSSLIFAGKDDPAWNQQTWASLQGQGPEGVRRKLSNQASTDFDILIAQARPGKGKIHLLPSSATILGGDETKSTDASRAPLIAPRIGNAGLVSADASPTEKPASLIHETDRVEKLERSSLPELQGYASVENKPAAGDDELPEFQVLDNSAHARRTRTESKAVQALREITNTVANGAQRAITSFGLLLGKLFPEELFQTIPSSVMAMMAVMIPLIVVTIASVAYFQLGRSAQYQFYFSQAEETAIRAAEQSDLLDQRLNWIATLSYLDQAEKYQFTQPSQTLRLQAQFALDDIDLVKRVDYQPAIEGGLAGDVNISKMVVSAGDLYLLDSNSGKVLRARSTTQGYQLDSSFQCEPLLTGAQGLSALIDIVAWPAGYEPNASVLGVDQGGNLAFCQPGSPVAVMRLALPQSAVGSVKAIDISANELFVISQGTRAVWAFNQKNYQKAPRDYFTNDLEKPDNLDSAVSLVVDRDDLYLLHQDGSITYCSTVDLTGVPVRCQEAGLVDMRPGRERSTLIPSTPFRQMMISSPPDPSLFFLEASNHSVYHFSLRSLVFQRQYMPRRQISILPATAFTIYPERRTLFMAIGNEVYYGAIP